MAMINVLGGGVKNDFGEITIWETGENGEPRMRKRFTYACGHCSNQVLMHDQRERPRLHCVSCDRWLCEQSELCHTQCTPLYTMARDGFEGMGSSGRLVPALMQGVTTLDEAERLNLVETSKPRIVVS
jgi:hypothetical protein